jgi:tRNA A37 methylthiotransferase MiaB
MPIDYKKNNVVMLGSLPMALDELALAPAIISNKIKKKGYNFKFIDINLELFEKCNQNIEQYQEKTQILQGFNDIGEDPIIRAWNDQTLKEISTCQYLIVNVFSHFSQATAYRFIQQVRQRYPEIKIFVGGIGSQKKVSNSNDDHIQQWIAKNFKNTNSDIFGELLLINQLIDSWQTDITTSEIDKKIPTQLNLQDDIPALDFSIYKLDGYQWPDGGKRIPMLGSYGCVRQCSFCDVLKHFPKYNFIEADELTKSIVEAYNQTGISKIAFMDSLVNGSMSNFLSILQNLKQSKENGWLPDDFSWSGTYICRPQSTLLDQIHNLLPLSGVENLIIGVESGSDRVRFEMQKKFTNQDLLYELTAFQQQLVKTRLLFFSSWPTETPDDFNNTIKLFHDLAPFAQQGTVDRISLGSNGFGLIDGTPIDRDKDKIGLSAGPAPFLWTCSTNPDLTFWETLRRRFAMAEVCENLGIQLDTENTYRHYLNFILNNHQSMIKEYSGSLGSDAISEILYQTALNIVDLNSTLKMTVVNSGDNSVQVELLHNSTMITQFECSPGLTDLEWKLKTDITKSNEFKLKFRFNKNHKINWQQYENKDYYNSNGVYLDNIYLDYRNITFWGWNQLVTQRLINPQSLPSDYHNHINKRAVTQDTDLEWHVGAGRTIQKSLLEILNPEEHQQRIHIDQQLVNNLKKYL